MPNCKESMFWQGKLCKWQTFTWSLPPSPRILPSVWHDRGWSQPESSVLCTAGYLDAAPGPNWTHCTTEDWTGQGNIRQARANPQEWWTYYLVVWIFTICEMHCQRSGSNRDLMVRKQCSYFYKLTWLRKVMKWYFRGGGGGPNKVNIAW